MFLGWTRHLRRARSYTVSNTDFTSSSWAHHDSFLRYVCGIVETMSTDSRHISVLTTGGTIACTTGSDGSLVPTVPGGELLATVDTHACLHVRELTRLDSSSITLAQVDALIDAVHEELADPRVAGIVVTHGTDSMEDSAIALDCVHGDPRPVVLTGAQRPFDHPATDGPGNLSAAVALAADPTARSRGVLLSFGGRTVPARGAVKRHTTDLDAFTTTTEQPLPRPTPLPPTPLDGTEVMILAAWPGAGRELVDAAVAAGAHGLVIEAMGSGNIGADMGRGVRDALAAGVAVVVSTRVAAGQVALAYGGSGGGATLATHGAVAAGHLRAGQARMVLATALAAGRPVTDLL